MKTKTRFWSYLAHFWLEWAIFSEKLCKEIQNTHFLSINVLFSKIAFDEKV